MKYIFTLMESGKRRLAFFEALTRDAAVAMLRVERPNVEVLGVSIPQIITAHENPRSIRVMRKRAEQAAIDRTPLGQSVALENARLCEYHKRQHELAHPNHPRICGCEYAPCCGHTALGL